ncbi:unnamed protein product [Candidula unifasciata]|uniref:G-protein coupled receptors family 1 profile domain-containing protein n=1 Tax=Candidula unifasciata TaxID=100452 RepID=A0A8S3YQM6_9EUPU|nr:unnamed protein product [Candidula unifasciata]
MTAYSVDNSTLGGSVVILLATTANSEILDSQGLPCSQNVSEQYKDFYLTAQYITGLIAYPILCIIGIIGNLLALLVFRHRDMRTSTNVYLMSLVVSDTLKLLNDVMYFIIVAISLHNSSLSQKMMSTMYPVAHYVFNMSACVTSWLTVSVAVERYISVCHASRAKELCTIPRARYVCTIVFVLMSIVALPSAFRYEMRTVHDRRHNMTCTLVLPTHLGRNTAFMVPYSWILNSSRGIIPVFILIFLNVRIINELRKERVKGKKFTARNRITLMLIVIVFMFLICVTPDAIMSTVFGKGYVDENYLVKGVREITDTLLLVNSSVSFFLYFAMSIVFRSTFFKIFCQFYPNSKDSEAIQLYRKSSYKTTDKHNSSPEFIVGENGCTTKNKNRNCTEDYL